ncbi:MAG: DUF3034 family protein [Thiobacillaceae bacterium]
MKRYVGHVFLAMLLGASIPALAGSRLLATGGVTQIEGAGGGGLTPWALIAGYGSNDEVGVTATYTSLKISDFDLDFAGVAVGIHDRIEFSAGRQRLDLGTTVPGESIAQDVVGLKLKLSGDAVFDQDTWKPQVAVGVQYKHNRNFDFVPKLLGARRDSGVDVYVSATKLYLAALSGRNVLLNATLRATRANQMGLLGFGGDRSNAYSAQFEGSAAVLLNDHLALGIEYRHKPDNLSVFKEDSYRDAFLAWMPNKHLAFTLAYAYLGTVADKADQQALYASIQLGY